MENDEAITEQTILTKKFNDLCTDIVERSCRVRPTKLNLVNSSACILHDLVIAKRSSFSKTSDKLKDILESESKYATGLYGC